MAAMRAAAICIALAVLVTVAPVSGHAFSLAVFPPRNETGVVSLDWFSLGLQDSMTVDLWHVGSIRTLTFPDFITIADKAPLTISLLAHDEAVALARRIEIDEVWLGQYRGTPEEGLTVEYRAIDPRTGKELYCESVSAPLGRFPAAGSQLVISMLEKKGVKLSPAERERILAAKTSSLKSFELNAKGYEYQQQLSLVRVSKSSPQFEQWIKLLEKAVAEDRRYAEAWVNLGWARLTRGDREGAGKAFGTALNLKPYLLDAHMGMGYVARAAGDQATALEAITRAVRLNPSLAWTRRELLATIEATTSAAAEQQLTVLSQDGDPEIRFAALKGAAKVMKERAVPLIKAAIPASDQPVELVNLLLSLNRKDAVPYLMEIVEKRNLRRAPGQLAGFPEQTVVAAIQLLGKSGERADGTSLIGALGDKRPVVREAAALALGDMGEEKAVSALSEVAAKDPAMNVRTAALVALALLGERKAFQSLGEVVRNSDGEAGLHATKLIRARKKRFVGTELVFVMKR
ncbi:MAG: HEAT repeat domain-containing protein [Geobacter sp.]|nr:HEAT repeat domain-containing protein [Geobacter sp.]